MPAPEPTLPGEETEPIFELAAERPGDLQVSPSAPERPEPCSEAASAPAPASAHVPPSSGASQPSVHKAIEEVNAIVDFLRGALDEMEEVLEMLELFERQQNADEQEIESLRRALRQAHRPRDGGHQR